MSVKEQIVRLALLRSRPQNLEDVLTTIEAYRMCAGAARKLRRVRALQDQRRQLLECARDCESALSAFAETGKMRAVRYPRPEGRPADLIFVQKW